MHPDLPDWREKRNLLWGEEAPDEEKNRLAEAFLAAGRLNDAANFFDRARNLDGLRRVMMVAAGSGDWFLFKKCRDALKEPLTDETRAVAENAMKAGKFMYAYKAFRDLGDPASAADAMKKLREIHPDSEILIRHLET